MERKTKGLVLKTSVQNDSGEEAENAEHDETLSLLTRKFNRFLKKKGRDETQQKKRYPKPN